MTDAVNTEGNIDQGMSSATDATQTPAPTTSTPSEKMLRQSEVNDLVGRSKSEAYERGKREAMAELQKQQSSQPQNTQTTQHVSQTQTDASSPDLRSQVERHVQDMIAQQQREAYANQVLQSFTTKLQAGAQKYSDFENVIKPLGLETVPEILELANAVDNTADVMYELGKNPLKIGSLVQLAQRNPALALSEMRKLADSIKANEAGAKFPEAAQPLSQVKSSPTGVDNGKMTVRDWKRHPKFQV